MGDLQRFAWIKSTFLVDLLVLHIIEVYRDVRIEQIDWEEGR